MSKNKYIFMIGMAIMLIVSAIQIDSVCRNTELHQTLKVQGKSVEDSVVVAEIPEIPKYNIPLSDEHQILVYSESEDRGLSYTMVLALMWKESKMDITAINYNSDGSSDGGLLQINDETADALAEEIGITNFDPNDPYMNIRVGIYYLGILRDNFSQYFSDEDTFSAMCVAYNRGGNNTMRMIEQYGFSFVEESDYAKDVLKYKEELETTGTFSDYVEE